jgi:hypothetical protein
MPNDNQYRDYLREIELDGANVDKSYTVDMTDLAILIENWLQSGCLD